METFTIVVLAFGLLFASFNIAHLKSQSKEMQRQLEAVSAVVHQLDTGCNKLSVYP